MLTTRRGFFGAVAAFVGVAGVGAGLTTGAGGIGGTGIHGTVLGVPTTGTWGAVNRSTFSFWHNRQNSAGFESPWSGQHRPGYGSAVGGFTYMT